VVTADVSGALAVLAILVNSNPIPHHVTDKEDCLHFTTCR
jgi:hypothetical protein